MGLQPFGSLHTGELVHRVTLTGGSLSINVLSYGAVIQDLRLAGHQAPLVLGFTEFAPYLTHSPYFGAIAGRCANRIRDGHLELNGKEFQLDRNFLGKHHLHGGAASLGKRLWQIDEITDSAVALSIKLTDGEMGYPGNMAVQVKYHLLANGVLDIRMQATADAPTLCNLAHHSYFNLDGGNTISDHELHIAADAYLPVDDELIPTGEVRSVASTGFDFRQPAAVSRAHPIDANFCISDSRGSLKPVAWLSSPESGVVMECHTTEPGLQVYDGANIDIALPGLMGKSMGAYSGLAMEPQVWPDAQHHRHFPQAVLQPGDTYAQHTQYIFSKEGK
jgi:aldose 1-epimerase